mgnify:CR=1 FL=1
MLVSDVVTTIKASSGYIANSLILKSSNAEGCTYKYLQTVGTVARRREWFISTSTSEDDVTVRTVIADIEVLGAD